MKTINLAQLDKIGICQRAHREFYEIFGVGDVEINLENMRKLHDGIFSANYYCACLIWELDGDEAYYKFYDELDKNRNADQPKQKELAIDLCLKALGALKEIQ